MSLRGILSELRFPHRHVDDQGRTVQSPYFGKYLSFLAFFSILFGLFCAFIFILVLSAQSDVKGVAAVIFLLVFALSIAFFPSFLMYRASHAWYWEDDEGFEMLSLFRHKKFSVSYKDLAPHYYINYWGYRTLHIATNSGQKIIVNLPFYRPLILLNTLMDCKSKYSNKLEKEYVEHIRKTREEMKKTGIRIDFPVFDEQ